MRPFISYVTPSGGSCPQWDLTSCAVDNAWRLTLVGTLNNFGRIIGVPLSGCFSDKFGRRTLMLAGLSVAGVIGVVMSFSPNYIMYAVLEFFNPLFTTASRVPPLSWVRLAALHPTADDENIPIFAKMRL